MVEKLGLTRARRRPNELKYRSSLMTDGIVLHGGEIASKVVSV